LEYLCHNKPGEPLAPVGHRECQHAPAAEQAFVGALFPQRGAFNLCRRTTQKGPRFAALGRKDYRTPPRADFSLWRVLAVSSDHLRAIKQAMPDRSWQEVARDLAREMNPLKRRELEEELQAALENGTFQKFGMREEPPRTE
jgi:hypothetical protein